MEKELKKEVGSIRMYEVYKTTTGLYVKEEICDEYNVGNKNDSKIIKNNQCLRVLENDIEALSELSDNKLIPIYISIFDLQLVLSFNVIVDKKHNNDLYVSSSLCKKNEIHSNVSRVIDGTVHCKVTEEDLETIENNTRNDKVTLKRKYIEKDIDTDADETEYLFMYYYDIETNRSYIPRKILELCKKLDISIEGKPKIINDKNCYSITEEELKQFETMSTYRGVERIINPNTPNEEPLVDDVIPYEDYISTVQTEMEEEKDIIVEETEENKTNDFQVEGTNSNVIEEANEQITESNLNETNENTTEETNQVNELEPNKTKTGNKNVIKSLFNNNFFKHAIEIIKDYEESENETEPEQTNEPVEEDYNNEESYVEEEKHVFEDMLVPANDYNNAFGDIEEDTNSNESTLSNVNFFDFSNNNSNVENNTVENEEPTEEQQPEETVTEEQVTEESHFVPEETIVEDTNSHVEEREESVIENTTIEETVVENEEPVEEQQPEETETIPRNVVIETIIVYRDRRTNKLYIPEEYATNIDRESRTIMNRLCYLSSIKDLEQIYNKRIIIVDVYPFSKLTYNVIVCNNNGKFFVPERTLKELDIQVVLQHKIMVNKEIYAEITRSDLDTIRAKENKNLEINIELKHITPTKKRN